ncbi:MAG: tetratricopeptide repeat protein [Acidobacteriota bacterium]|nr:tetratricopeptide repeat protein [Acidobacteriota bacterium]
MKSTTEPSDQQINPSGQETNPASPSSAGSLPDRLSPESVRAELQKILSSPGFINADRLTKFLRHVVEGALEGQNDRLKESLLGSDVFGRKPSYDPRIDAVVRTEAVKLRARLKEYYETSGREDALRIDLPKGGYVPAFHLQEHPAAPVEPLTAPASTIPASPGALPVPEQAPPNWKVFGAGALIVLALALSLIFAIKKGPRTADGRGPELDSIAVLPFSDLSSAGDQEYFCDGMTDEIIDALTKIGGLRVVARTSSFAFKGKQQDIREIGKKLNVGAVLEGSVRKFGDKLRVTAQLNSVADGYHLWSETYERELKDVFQVQDEISQAIVNTLQAKLASARSPVRPQQSVNLEAYDRYLKGRYHWQRWRTEGAEKAIQSFNQAIAADPRYAPAYAGLADSYTWLGFFSAVPPNEAMPKAKQAAMKAIDLDDSLAAAHASLAYVKALYDFDWPGAEQEFRRAIQLNPGLSDAHFGYGIVYLAAMGKTKAAVREMEMARDLDPLSLPTITYLGLAYMFDGHRSAAIDQYKKALELDPAFEEAHLNLAQSYLEEGKVDEYYSEIAKVPADPTACRTGMSRALGLAFQGKREQAMEEIRKWENPPKGVYVRPTSIAGAYGALNDREHAFHWLDKAYQDRDGMLAYLNYQGALRKYRADPRFTALIQKLGLPK